MTAKKKTRREALRAIVATAAAAAGLSAIEIEALLAQVKKTADLTKLAGIKPTDDSVKALKVRLAPKTQAAQVFQSEFGKAPALKPTIDAATKKPVCAAYLGSGACMDLGCNLVVCNGLTFGSKLQPGVETAQPIGGRTNAASGGGEGFNKTGGSTGCSAKGLMPTCGLYSPAPSVNLGDVKVQWLRSKQSDPYIQALMKELEVTSPDALEAQLAKVLMERRAGM